jgi:hypothetical protein
MGQRNGDRFREDIDAATHSHLASGAPANVTAPQSAHDTCAEVSYHRDLGVSGGCL